MKAMIQDCFQRHTCFVVRSANMSSSDLSKLGYLKMKKKYKQDKHAMNIIMVLLMMQ